MNKKYFTSVALYLVYMVIVLTAPVLSSHLSQTVRKTYDVRPLMIFTFIVNFICLFVLLVRAYLNVSFQRIGVFLNLGFLLVSLLMLLGRGFWGGITNRLLIALMVENVCSLIYLLLKKRYRTPPLLADE